MAPTKADHLFDRMLHTFGRSEIERILIDMMRHPGSERTVLDLLSDEARDILLRRCLIMHKYRRKFAAENRRHYKEKAA